MNRRAFFVGVGFLGGAAGPIGALLPPDRHSYKAWHVVWGGWRQPMNQMVEFGMWMAHTAGESMIVVATTMGRCGEYHELDVIDTSLDADWPRPIRLTDAMRDDLKRRALALLYEHLT